MRLLLALALVTFPAAQSRSLAQECPRQPPIHQLYSPAPVFKYVNDELWNYLRRGLTYLESPNPLDPPEAVPPAYVHPDGRGYGAYGLSPEAYEDVRRLYPFFKGHPWEEILSSPRLYDLANRALCDWMIKNLSSYFSDNAGRKEIFSVVHKAWNLGVSGFKKGRKVVPSRARRAEEFLGEERPS